MKVWLATLLLAQRAQAFTSPVSSGERTSLASSFEDEIGAQSPLGFFDPLGLLNDADDAKFNRLRYVEIKHGRISMLAIIGHMVTTGNLRVSFHLDRIGLRNENLRVNAARSTTNLRFS